MKTIRVRICVAVDCRGHWHAVGLSDKGKPWHDSHLIEEVERSFCADGPHHCVFVEADVPLPVVHETIQGAVTCKKCASESGRLCNEP